MRLRPLAGAAQGVGALGVYSVASSALIASALALTAWLSVRHYRALPAVEEATGGAAADGAWPRVSVIVPARNEERNLPRLLASLLALDYPAYEVIVVDDGSTDDTAAIANDYADRSHMRMRLLAAPGPEPGWTGKNAACAFGAAAADGDWLLFTDADTEHAAASLRAAIHTARSQRVGALSLFTQQECRSFWERLLLPFAYQQYFSGVRPTRLLDPSGPALANGQYFLISRAAYDASGGHSAVRGSLIDDVALATALKRAGSPPLPCRGERFVRVRMYHSLRELVEGFTKNSFQFLREQRVSAGLVVLGTACAAGLLPAFVGAILYEGTPAIVLCVGAYAIQVAGLTWWARVFDVPAQYALLAPVAALVFTGIAVSSLLHVAARRPVRWKGRGYPAHDRPLPAATAQERARVG
jgi:chlorobactene glucosyltransferase